MYKGEYWLCFIGLLVLILQWNTNFVDGLPTPEKIKAFEEWYKSKNPIGSHITLGESCDNDQQRPGVIANQDITVDEVLFKVPFELLISKATADLSAVGSITDKIFMYYSNGKEYDPGYYEVLSIYILYEKYYNPDSEWKPWLDMLPEPEEMDNILFCRYADLKELQGSPLLKRANDRRAEVKERYSWHSTEIFKIYTKIFPTVPTETQYKWAVSIVRSRNHQVHAYGFMQPVIAPYYDMFRDKPQDIDETYYDYDGDENEFIVTAREPVKKGEEIFTFWGEKCNSELLDFQGFIINDNVYDCVHVDLELAKNDPLRREKQILYELIYADSSQLKFVKNGLTQELINAVRSITITEEELTPEMLIYGVPDEPLNLRSELAIADYIVNICRKAYKSYATTIEEDEEILKDPELKKRLRLIVQVRKGEKEIIRKMGMYYHTKTLELAEQISKEEEGEGDGVHDEL